MHLHMIELCSFQTPFNWQNVSFRRVSTNITYKRWSLCNHGNMLKWPLVWLYRLQWYNIGHNGHIINLYGVIMICMGNTNTNTSTSETPLFWLHLFEYPNRVWMIPVGSRARPLHTDIVAYIETYMTLYLHICAP